MTSRPFALAALLLALPAFADDPPPAPAPAPAPAPPADAKAPEAKKERKADPAAAKALERYMNAAHLPASAGVKEITAKGEFEAQGMTFGIHPTWNAEKGFDFAVTLPAEAIEMGKAQGATEEQVQAEARGQFAGLVYLVCGLNSAFEAPGRNWEHFDITSTTQGDDEIVTLTPFDAEADADGRVYTFGKDGLLKSLSVNPKAGDDPQMQMMKDMGLTFDASFSWEKRGDRSVMTGRTLTIGPQEFATKFAFFDSEKGPYLLRQASFTLPDGDHSISFHDYSVDGKSVESTKSAPQPEAAKPAEPAPKKDEPAPAPAPSDAPK